MSLRRNALLVAASAAALVLGTPAAGSAAGAKSTTYAASWSFGGSVAGAVSGLQLTDYATSAYYDRVTGSPSGGDQVTIAGSPCQHGNAYQSGLSLYGADEAWANMAVGTAQGARVEIACLTANGEQHRFHWGNAKNRNGSYVLPSTNCVVLSRPTTTSFELTVPADCPAQDEIVNTRGTQLSAATYSVAFTSTVTVPGLR